MSFCCHVEVSTPSRRDTFICSVSISPILEGVDARADFQFSRLLYEYVKAFMVTVVISDIVMSRLMIDYVPVMNSYCLSLSKAKVLKWATASEPRMIKSSLSSDDGAAQPRV